MLKTKLSRAAVSVVPGDGY